MSISLLVVYYVAVGSKDTGMLFKEELDHETMPSTPVDKRSDIACSETVVDVDDAYV